jgi:hypothetical protein
MAFESMKKAATVALPTMAATPQVLPVASRGGHRYNPGDRDYAYDGPLENPIEILAARRDEALVRVREGQGLLDRARVLFQLAQRAPYYGSFAARPTPQELAEIKHANRAVEEYSAALDEANRVLEAATTRLNLKLMGVATNQGVEPE